MNKPVYIAAYHQSEFGKLMGMTVPEIIKAAVAGACGEIKADASVIDVGSVGATCTYTLNQQGLLAGLMAAVPGLGGKPIESVENACASGGQAILSVIYKLLLGLGRRRHGGRLREDARRRGQDGRQAHRPGARRVLAPGRAPGQGLHLPAHLRRGDEGLHDRPTA